MIRGLLAIVVGFGASFVVVGIFAPALPMFLPSISCLVGGFFAGLIGKKRGVVYGGIVSIGIFILLVQALISIAHRYSGGYIFPDLLTLGPNLASILFGPIGGWLGEKIRGKEKPVGSGLRT